MPAINRSALLPYTQRQLFDLVNDIEAYPDYLEGCVGARILYRGHDLVEARLDLARGGIAQSFTTRNRLRAPEAIELELREGPFEHFAGGWRFEPLGTSGCRVSLALEFSSRQALVGAAAGRLFDGVSSRLVDAVVRRAAQLYG